MPELPEIEHVVRSLASLVVGTKILEAELRRAKLMPSVSKKRFAKEFRGAKFVKIWRRGKHILLDLSTRKTLIVHLRMTGRFVILPVQAKEPKHSHALFYLSDDTKLIFEDQRHFGFMKLSETSKLDMVQELKHLAPEPLSDEFSVTYFKKTLQSSKRSLKSLLLDQTRICGLGNIYAAEALFLARLNPKTVAHRVSALKAGRLHKFIREVLMESIEYSRGFRIDAENLESNFYSGKGNHWLVYDREGLPCQNCKTKIRRIKQNGRSSYFCPKCQVLRK